MYIPLNCKTHYSVLEAYQKPKNLAKRLQELGIERCGICENGNLSSCVQALNAIPNGIIGIDLGYALVFAQNLDGWYELIKIGNNVMPLDMANNVVIIYTRPVEKYIDGSWYGVDLTSRHASEMRKIGGSRTVAIPTCLAASEQDEKDYQVVMCIRENDNLDSVREKFGPFFEKSWYLRTYDDLLQEGYTTSELSNTVEISNMCETPKLPSALQIPIFRCPGGITSNEYFKNICREGFINLGFEGNQTYIKQAQHELAVIEKYKLEDYFLIIRDIIRYVNDKYGMCGVRGSAAGCLLSYLSEITKTDPIKYNLVFERFLNEGRFTAERIQPPDIDIDVPSESREDTIRYIREKYGEEYTGQILTYQTIKSPAAIKAVFRVKRTMAFDKVNQITKSLPADHKISDKMQDSGDTSVIMWVLKHRPELLEEFVTLNKDKLDGQFKDEFDQAIRLEGTFSARSKHAAGIIVSRDPLTECCPLIWDDVINSYMCGMEMNDLESIGLLKLDLLGLRAFDKILGIKEMIGAI